MAPPRNLRCFLQHETLRGRIMRLLIADDDRAAASSLSMLARSWGFEPVTAHSGTAALALFRAPDPPSLAVLDWFMPDLNGVDVCREVRKETDKPYTYVVLLTGQGSKEAMIDGLEAGADDFLIKPADPCELHARLTTAKRILALQDQLLATQRQLRQQATRDSLTGLWNRAMILEILERELARSARECLPVGVIMADIDHFKQINDTFGHLAGDQVLRQAGQRLLALLRPYDTVGRYGGEEFLVVLPGCDADLTRTLAERLRRCVEETPARDGEASIPFTVSIGTAAWDGMTAALELLRLADGALYQAKRAGRNCIVSAES
jgi:two-component system cell cycle response regulator